MGYDSSHGTIAHDNVKVSLRDAGVSEALPAFKGTLSKISDLSNTQVSERIDKALLPKVDCFGLVKYIFLCGVAINSIAILAILLWSDIGFGAQNLQKLREYSQHRGILMGSGFLVMIFLYVVDFFVPPHLDGTYLTLGEYDFGQGRLLFFCGLMSMLSALLVSVDSYPHFPLLLTILVAPLFLYCIRRSTRKAEVHRRQSLLNLDHAAFRDRSTTMSALLSEESDAIGFYTAVTIDFALTSVVTSIVWFVWVFHTSGGEADGPLDGTHAWDNATAARIEAKGINEDFFGENYPEVMFLVWCSPTIVSVSMLIFAGIALLRVMMHRGYSSTDEYKHALLEAMRPKQSQKIRDSMIEKKKKSIREMTRVVKFIVCIFCFFAGVLWVTGELGSAEYRIAHTIKVFLGAFFMGFIIFLHTALGRLWRAMHTMLQGTPLYRTGAAIKKSDWTRAIAVWTLTPFVPLLLVLSCVTQRIRNWRDLYSRMLPSSSAQSLSKGDKIEMQQEEWQELQRQRLLTEKVHNMYLSVRTWKWTSVLTKVYWIGVIYFVMNVGTNKAMNILLSWLNSCLAGLPFAVTCVAFYIVGLVCFLLPPVPGPPVYLFGGMVVVKQCPWGFWEGTILTIILSWLLKLNACGMQQKCIGEMLGHSPKVRQLCGVNTPEIKAIEMVLRRPGMTLGKCAILCGGPDWPTSVGAGLLRLPVSEMLFGTVPIIIFVAPCVCTGSFYLRQEESSLWMRSASMMLTSTLLICCILWIAAAWCIQETLDENYRELKRPRPEHVHLDWLGFQGKELGRVTEERLQWEKLPCTPRAAMVTGAFLQIVAGQIFYWMDAVCFGEFSVTSSPEELSALDWDFVKPMGRLGLAVVGLSWFSWWIFSRWSQKSTGPLIQKRVEELAQVEEAWKAARLAEAMADPSDVELSRIFSDSDLGSGESKSTSLDDVEFWGDSPKHASEIIMNAGSAVEDCASGLAEVKTLKQEASPQTAAPSCGHISCDDTDDTDFGEETRLSRFGHQTKELTVRTASGRTVQQADGRLGRFQPQLPYLAGSSAKDSVAPRKFRLVYRTKPRSSATPACTQSSSSRHQSPQTKRKPRVIVRSRSGGMPSERSYDSADHDKTGAPCVQAQCARCGAVDTLDLGP